ncbi:MAG: cytochrome c, partial [Candidatus Marinimicrobia bacterium]|nr:cytochrome c [Candidatus Neomarinimicrobiota bacterium]
MKIKSVIVASMMMPAVAMAWPWSTDMMNQPNIKPQEGAMLDFPERSIPIAGMPTQIADREASRKIKNPVQATAESVNTGRTLFKIYCAACHG